MIRRQLSDVRVAQDRAVLRAERGVGRRGKDDRNFIEAVLWWRRQGLRSSGTFTGTFTGTGRIQGRALVRFSRLYA